MMSTNCKSLLSTPTPSVAIIGGGFSGICAAIQLKKRFCNATGECNISITIFDENSDFGGVWLVNKYPGCAPEAASPLYSYSFAPNPNWTKVYATQPEVCEYLMNVAKKHDLYEHARFGTQVKSADWMEDEGVWEIQSFDKNSGNSETLRFKYIIGATGPFRFPKKPAEFLDFKGPVFHSAEWDDSVDLRGKKVGVIGSGASALQIIPAIAPLVKELHSFQRTPTWVILKPLDFSICVLIQKLFSAIPFLLWLFRLFWFLCYELWFNVFRANSLFHRLAALVAKWILWFKVWGDKTLVEKLTPDHKFGCRAVHPSSKFYSTFKLPHVHLHRGKVERVEGNRIKMEGENGWQDLDVLILATGFRVQDFWAPLELRPKKDGGDIVPTIGKAGSGFGHYFGVTTNALPNFFIVLGPNTTSPHNSLIFMIECQVNFLAQLIRHAEKTRAKSVVVKKSAQDKCMRKIQNGVKSTVWQAESCGGWLKNDDGDVNAVWPGTSTSYWWKTRRVHADDFHFTYSTEFTIEVV